MDGAVAPARINCTPVVMGPGSRFACPGRRLKNTRFHVPAQHFASGLCQASSPFIRGRRECRVRDAPAALRANEKSTQASHRRFAGNVPAFPARMVLTVSFVLSPEIGLGVSVIPEKR